MKFNIDKKLYYVTDERLESDEKYFSNLEECLLGGVEIVQLREKNINSREFYLKAKKLKDFLSSRKIPLVINDRLDIALAVQAEGVHLGQKDIPYHIARKILGSNVTIGISVSNLAEAMELENTDVDHIGVGPIYPTSTKKDHNPAMGLMGLKEIREFTKKEIVAIGGIDLTNAREVIDHGAHSLAVVSCLSQSDDPRTYAMELCKTLRS